MGDLVATVVVPTTGDRGALLRLSIPTVLAQTVKDLEVFVIGDGVSDGARETISELMAGDSRIRFFDHPKHPRRGEPYRHAALAEARGRIVCYLTDRDLMLSHHVAELAELLQNADFAHTFRVRIERDGKLRFRNAMELISPESQPIGRQANIPLSFAAHTLAMYRKLPGWRETPQGTATDMHMWEQFIRHPECRVARSLRPTILYFKRGDHPGWPVAKRAAEIDVWSRHLEQPGWTTQFEQRVRRLWAPRSRFARMRRSMKRWVRNHAGEAPRSTRPTIRDVEAARVQGEVELEVYWVESEGGPGASVYVHGDEVLRLDCFGEDRGHMHVNLHQARRLPMGNEARIFFPPGSMEEHIERAGFELVKNLGYALSLNRRAKVRAVQLDPVRLAYRAGWMQQRMLERVESRRERLSNGSSDRLEASAREASADSGRHPPSERPRGAETAT